jgi:hypothetical protein
MARRQQLVVYMILAVSAFLGISFVLAFRNQSQGTRSEAFSKEAPHLADSVLHGESVVAKLENATLKYAYALPF